MKKLRLLGLLGPALLLVPVIACEDSSSQPATPFTFEAGPGFEAGPPAEAGPPVDAGGDAADVFVPPSPKGVTVTVIDNSLPKANVRVISQDAMGAVIGDAKTDVTGKLTLATAPSTVTILATSNTQLTPVTFFAVADGDTLTVRIPPGVAVEQSPIGHYSVSFTAGGLGQSPNATVAVNGVNGCSGSSSDTTTLPALVDLFPSCLTAANAVLATGKNTDFNLDGFAFKKGVAAPAANATNGVTLPSWTTPGATTLKATHVPGVSISNTASLYMIANGASFAAGTALGSNQFDTTTGQTFATATGFADAFQSFINTVDDESGLVQSSIIRREPAPATGTTTLAAIDFMTALPYITATAVDTTTAARPLVTLTSDAPLTSADGGIVVLSSSNASETSVTWTFVLPASAAASFKAPALPTDADALTFTPVGISNVTRVVFFEATQLPGYKETKLIPIVPLATLGLLDASVPLPVDGTVRLTSWSPQPPPPPVP